MFQSCSSESDGIYGPVGKLRARVGVLRKNVEELVDGVAHVHWRDVPRVVGRRPDAAQLHEVEDSAVSTEHLERFNNKKHSRSPASWQEVLLHRHHCRRRAGTFPKTRGSVKELLCLGSSIYDGHRTLWFSTPFLTSPTVA